MYVRQLNATTLELYFSGKKYGITSENASEVAKFKELAVKHNDDVLFHGLLFCADIESSCKGSIISR